MCKIKVSHGQTDYRMLSAASLTDKVRIKNIIRTTYLQGAMFKSSKCALLKIPIWRQNLGCGTLYSLFWLLPDLHAKVVKLSDFRNVQFIYEHLLPFWPPWKSRTFFKRYFRYGSFASWEQNWNFRLLRTRALLPPWWTFSDNKFAAALSSKLPNCKKGLNSDILLPNQIFLKKLPPIIKIK